MVKSSDRLCVVQPQYSKAFPMETMSTAVPKQPSFSSFKYSKFHSSESNGNDNNKAKHVSRIFINTR